MLVYCCLLVIYSIYFSPLIARRHPAAPSVLGLEITSAKYPGLLLRSVLFHPTRHNLAKSFTFPLIFNNMTLISVWDFTKSIFNIHISSKILFMMIYVLFKTIDSFSSAFLFSSWALTRNYLSIYLYSLLKSISPHGLVLYSTWIRCNKLKKYIANSRASTKNK